MKRLTEDQPAYPLRSEARLQEAFERLRHKEWTRLEGAPDTEAALKKFHGGGEVWYLASGTAALQAIMLGHEVGPGDEVITTAYTWGATVAAILAIGAVPVFADILPEAPLLDPESVKACIGPKTKAILAVHLFGFPCDMTTLKQIADAADLVLLEDGSQAHGARHKAQRVGTLGHAAAFSCMGLKPLAGTEGGYAVFQDSEAAERAYLHGKHPRGLSPDRARALAESGQLDALQLGWRPCAVGAELVRSGLDTLVEENRGRRENARKLRGLLQDLPGIGMDPEPEGSEPIYHLLSIRLDSGLNLSPAMAVERLAPTGLSCFHYIPTPLHKLKRMQWQEKDQPPIFWHRQLREAGIQYQDLSLPHTEARCRSTIECGWNWTQTNPLAMQQIRNCLETLDS